MAIGVGGTRTEDCMKPFTYRRGAALLACWIALPAAAQNPLGLPQAPDQPNVYVQDSVDIKQKMQLLDGYLEQKNWAEAVDLLQTLAEKQGDRVVRTAAEEPAFFINLRAFCNARIAALPPDALAVYRTRVDGQAESLWRLWEQNRDPRPLHRIAEEFFCSTVADKAIDRLGDWAFAEGRLVDAVGWWMKLLPRDWAAQRGDSPPYLQFRVPTPRVDAARIAAKCVLARAFGGDVYEGKRLLEVLRAKHPAAKGRIAGVEGLYVETLARLLGSNEVTPPDGNDDFRTFAGDERRNKASATKADVGGLQYLWDFDADVNERDESPLNDLRLPHFPVVVGDAVYSASETGVWRFDLKTGKAARWLDFGLGRNGEFPRSKYTVTIKGSRLFVTIHDGTGGRNPEGRIRRFGPRREWHNVNSTLICFDLAAQKEIWRATPADFGGDRGSVFEGSPVTIGDDLAIAMTRYDAMSETSILRIDVNGRRVVWRTSVCESMAEGPTTEPPMYNLLSVGDSTIYYCTNLGAVAAVRADDGRLQWVATYTRRAPATTAPGDPSVPDLNPCVVHQGRVFALPRDGRRLLCYDAQTGEKQWESPAGLAFSQLLGAHDGVVVATGSKVCAFDVASGKVRWMNPINSTPGFGRGMIAGGDVYWPTRTEIHVFDVKSGAMARPPIELFARLGHRPGNLLHAGDYLLVAQSNRMLAFCSFSKLIERHRREITAAPDAPEPHFELGKALQQRGEFGKAAEAFAAAVDRAGTIRMVAGRRMQDEAKDRRFQSLLALAQERPADKSASAYREAFDAARTPEQQVTALSTEFAKADAQRRTAICQTVLDSKALRATAIVRSDGSSEPAGKWAATSLQGLVARHGRPLYAEQEAEFAKRLGDAKDSAALLELAERFPLAFTLSRTLQSRAEAALKEKNAPAAERLGKQWLAASESAVDEPSARQAIALLIRCNQSMGRAEAAYLWSASLSRRSNGDFPTRPDLRREEFDVRPGTTPASVAMTSAGVRDGVGRFDVQVSARGDATLLSWQADKASGHLPHVNSLQGPVSWVGRAAGGLAVAVGDDLVFLHGAEPKKPAWRKRVRETPRFRFVSGSADRRAPVVAASPARFLAAGDLVLVAADHHLVAFDAADGAERWQAPIAAGAERPPVLSLVDAAVFVETESESKAFDPMSGRVLFTVPMRIVSAAATNEILALAERNAIVGRDQRSGDLKWRVVLANQTVRDPIVVGGEEGLYVVADGAQLLAIARDGAVKSRHRLAGGPSVDAAAAVGGGTVCIAAGGTLECWDAGVGERRWLRRLESDDLAEDATFALAVHGDRVVAFHRGGGKEVAFDLKSGDPVKP
jgi:outer membrane protein assembly factor BamB